MPTTYFAIYMESDRVWSYSKAKVYKMAWRQPKGPDLAL